MTRAAWVLGAAGLLCLCGNRLLGEQSFPAPNGMCRIEATETSNEGGLETRVELKGEIPPGAAKELTWGYHLEAVRWSLDSRYAVLLFPKMQNGLPGEYVAAVYCVSDGSFRDLDEYFADGYIKGPDAGFSGKDDLELTIQLYHQPQEEIRMHVSLNEESAKMLSYGDEGDAGSDDALGPGGSPDGRWLALARTVPNPELPQRKDADKTLLYICGMDRSAEEDDPLCFDALGERRIDSMRWSPDSRFLVMTTSSNGGHSPINETTFVYCVSDRSLRLLSNYRFHSRVTGSGLGFCGENTALVEIYREDDENDGPDKDGYKIYTAAISLGSDYLKMPQLDGGEDTEGSKRGSQGPLTMSSRDGHWFAAIRSMPDEEEPWRQEKDHFRLIVLRTGSGKAKETFRYDGAPGRAVRMEWSPDSRYLVFTAEMAAGSEDASIRAGVYCVEDGSLRNVSHSIKGGELQNGRIYFDDEHTLILDVENEPDNPTRSYTDLDKETPKMEKMKAGKW